MALWMPLEGFLDLRNPFLQSGSSIDMQLCLPAPGSALTKFRVGPKVIKKHKFSWLWFHSDRRFCAISQETTTHMTEAWSARDEKSSRRRYVCLLLWFRRINHKTYISRTGEHMANVTQFIPVIYRKSMTSFVRSTTILGTHPPSRVRHPCLGHSNWMLFHS